MKVSYRIDRLQTQIQREISHIIKNQVKDPRIGFITITRVEVSRDLKYAKVYVSVYGDEDSVKQSLKGLESAKNFIRSNLGQSLGIRFTPEIIFKPDFSAVENIKIARILKELFPQDDEESK
jgi:ribosome-binding factor A